MESKAVAYANVDEAFPDVVAVSWTSTLCEDPSFIVKVT